MIDEIATLAGALRQELQQYGEMLALLDHQQKQIGARQAEAVSQTIAPIKTQGQAIQKARTHRDDCRARLAHVLQQARDLPFAKLIPLLPGESGALLGGLVKQNNEMLVRLRRRARQNHMQLSRSIELIRGLVRSIFPTRETRLYNERGSMKSRGPVQRLIYEAVG